LLVPVTREIFKSLVATFHSFLHLFFFMQNIIEHDRFASHIFFILWGLRLWVELVALYGSHQIIVMRLGPAGLRSQLVAVRSLSPQLSLHIRGSSREVFEW
jgi:hypothetical protein